MQTRYLQRGATALFAAGLVSLGVSQSAFGQMPAANQFQSGYSFAEQKEVKKVEWKASASAGFTLAAGNANVLTLSGGANASRNDGKNLLTLDLSGVYGLTTLAIYNSRDSMTGTLCPAMGGANCNDTIDNASELGTQQKTTAGFLLFKGRYDRFFTTNNAGFLAGYLGTDFTAGKKFNAGAQLGYSRQLFKTPLHELKAELGGDYNYVSYLGAEMMDANTQVHLASARLFVRYGLTLGENTQFEAKAESLINLNGAKIIDRYAGPADATRVNGSLALTTKIWGKLSFRFSFGIRYDNCPAKANLPFKKFINNLPENVSCTGLERHIEDNIAQNPMKGDGKFSPDELSLYRIQYLQKIDTLTEANLVFNFL